MRAAVVIVTKNDPRVTPCVRAIFDQRADFPFEVLVVDNGSTDGSRNAVAQAFGDRPDFRLVDRPGVFSGAWNHGAQSTTADILVRLDSDTVPHPGWLQALVDPLRTRPEIHWTAGAVVGPVPLRSLVQRYFHHRTLGYQRRLEGDPLPTDAVPSWNVAYRRAALDAAGWYDPWQRSSIDWDLHKRLSRRGLAGLYVPSAVLTHDHPSRLRDFYRKERWYRTGHWQMMLKYGPRSVLSTFVLPAAYLVLLFLFIAGLLVPLLEWVGLGLLGGLLLKQWSTALLEHDRVFWSRPFFRLVEATAAVHGLLYGLSRYGLRAPPEAVR